VLSIPPLRNVHLRYGSEVHGGFFVLGAYPEPPCLR